MYTALCFPQPSYQIRGMEPMMAVGKNRNQFTTHRYIMWSSRPSALEFDDIGRYYGDVRRPVYPSYSSYHHPQHHDATTAMEFGDV